MRQIVKAKWIRPAATVPGQQQEGGNKHPEGGPSSVLQSGIGVHMGNFNVSQWEPLNQDLILERLVKSHHLYWTTGLTGGGQGACVCVWVASKQPVLALQYTRLESRGQKLDINGCKWRSLKVGFVVTMTEIKSKMMLSSIPKANRYIFHKAQVKKAIKSHKIITFITSLYLLFKD